MPSKKKGGSAGRDAPVPAKKGPPFRLLFSKEADAQLNGLEADKALLKRLKSVRSALGHLELNPPHPGLNTHEYSSMRGPNHQKIWEAYAENRTPAAYRIFWYYGPEGDEITVLAITPHP